MKEQRDIIFQIVSGSDLKRQTFCATSPSGITVLPAKPQFNEDSLHSRITAAGTEHAKAISSAKAESDRRIFRQVFESETCTDPGLAAIAWCLTQSGEEGLIREIRVGGDLPQIIRLYQDTDQVTDGRVLGKPHPNIIQWANNGEMMFQSGKPVEMWIALTALSATDLSREPVTLATRLRVTMRPYSRAEIMDYLRHHLQSVKNTAGGISLCNGGLPFYDPGKPLEVHLIDPAAGTEEPIVRYDTWHDRTREDLRPYVYGTYERIFERLLEKFN